MLQHLVYWNYSHGNEIFFAISFDLGVSVPPRSKLTGKKKQPNKEKILTFRHCNMEMLLILNNAHD